MAEFGGSIPLQDVLRVREFRWLTVGLLQSEVGNQLARVALAVAVFERTGSASATTAVFALTFFPALAGGVLVAHIADRFPRRDVMIACDVIRAGLFAVMAALPLPIAVLFVLVAVAALLGPPFGSAQMALLPAVVGAERFPTAAAIIRTGDQIASLAGYGVGGVIVALVGARTALAVDAASFGLCALLLRGFVTRRSITSIGQPSVHRARRVLTVWRTVFADRTLRLLIALACTVSFYVTPEALAAPYAHQLGHGAVATGLLMASVAVGVALGNVLLLRLVAPERRQRLVGVLPAAAALPLIACVAAPPLPISLVLWFVCGLFCCFVVVVTARYSISVDDSIRGAAIGLASSCLLGSQGAASLLAGFMAGIWSPSMAIAVSASAGLALSVGLVSVSRRPIVIGPDDSAEGNPDGLAARSPLPEPHRTPPARSTADSDTTLTTPRTAPHTSC